MRTHRSSASAIAFVLAALVTLAGVGPIPVHANGGGPVSHAWLYRWWDPAHRVGQSWLFRAPRGVTAILEAANLPPGQAVTLWFIFFNRPDRCSTRPCSIPADVFSPETEADFHFGSGQVVAADGRATFAAHLPVGDISNSGKEEIGMGPGVALTHATRAEIVLALHSHGPASSGQTLKEQVTSFLGGCTTFNGTNGFADGPADVPDAPGECSTIQRSLHR